MDKAEAMYCLHRVQTRLSQQIVGALSTSAVRAELRASILVEAAMRDLVYGGNLLESELRFLYPTR